MAPSKLRKAIGAVKDQTSIGLAKVGSGGAAASELDVAIVKATRHSESFPADERHVREVIALTLHSRAYVGACVASLSRRLGRTRSWAVALKTLVLVHRLLADGDPGFEQEVFYATRRGTRMLNMSDFCDRSRTDAWDFSAFVRTYAAYLDDRLEYRMHAKHGDAARRGRPLHEQLYASPGNRFSYEDFCAREEDKATNAETDKAVALVARETPTSEMTLEQLLAKAQQLQHLLDRFIACRPVGAAKTNRVVSVSLYPLVKESVQLYCELTEVMAALVEQFSEMETDDCERVHAVFCGLAKQLDELEALYTWCKDAHVCRQSDVPEVELITQKKLELMDEFVQDRRAAAAAPQQRLPPPSPEPPSREASPVAEDDMNATKALPSPEEPAPVQEEHNAGETVPDVAEAPLIAADAADGEADFLNLKGDAMSCEEHGHQLALALFDGNPAGTAPTHDAFDASSTDWETALVQSASALASQRAELGGGLSMMVLDGMYSHATTAANAQAFSGSASSVAMRPPPGAPMLALPAPPGTSGAAASGVVDPFAASMAVPPPTYVQMSDMQTKQHQLVEEKMVWQQYGKNGMRGQGALAMLEQQRPPQLEQMLLPNGGYNYAGYHRTS